MTDVKTIERKRVLAKKADAAGWGFFFVWIGIAFLASVGWGVGLLGVGIIMLGVQLARRFLDLPLETFPLVVAGLFAFAGIWEIAGHAAPPGAFLPILFITAGALLLVSALMRRPVTKP